MPLRWLICAIVSRRFWRVNENAAQRARDEWQALPEDGAGFADPEHPFSGDLDLFGDGTVVVKRWVVPA